MFFGIFFLWHMPFLRDLIAGLKVSPAAPRPRSRSLLAFPLFFFWIPNLIGGDYNMTNEKDER